jgi:hypothetical protein
MEYGHMAKYMDLCLAAWDLQTGLPINPLLIFSLRCKTTQLVNQSIY